MELKQCECKSESVAIRESLDGDRPLYWGECRRCKRQSRTAETEQQAAAHWNNAAWKVNGVKPPKKAPVKKAPKPKKIEAPVEVPVEKKGRGRPKKALVV